MRSPILLFKGALDIFKGNPKLFVGIMFVPMVLSVVVGWLEPATGVVNPSSWIIFTVAVVISVVFSIFMGIAMIIAVDNRTITIIEAYQSAKVFFWRYIGLSIVMTAILFIGFLLLIVPGVILSVWFAFSTFVLILERSSIKEALTRSRGYVKGKWWGVFMRLIAIILVYILVMIVFGSLFSMLSLGVNLSSLLNAIVAIILTPVVLAYIYLLYQDVKSNANVSVSDVPSPASIEPDVPGVA